VAVATAVLIGAVASHADARTRTTRIVHFAGVPAHGVRASTPTTGKLLLSLRTIATSTDADTDWDLYADGRLIWQKWTPSYDATVVPDGARRLDTGYVQQRLTPKGARLVRSKILATGLFAHNLTLEVGGHHAWAIDQVRVGKHLVTVYGLPSGHYVKATPAQTSALTWIENLVANPERWLPASVWADRQIRAFVPARYTIDIERGYPDPAKLPPPVGQALAQQLKRRGGRVMTTRQTRALLQAFARAGIAPKDNHAGNIGFSLRRWVGHPSYFALMPALPDACF
jgi:hypothetical protein